MDNHQDDSKKCQNQVKILTLNRNGPSAFSPYKPSTILTNLQRGNVKTQTPVQIQERNIYELAAQGELYSISLDNGQLEQPDSNGFTPLIWAASYGQSCTVKMLIEKGANPKHKGNHGETALSFAAANGHIHVLKLLLNLDVDVNDIDDDGNTALMYAAYNNHTLCAYDLLKSGADIAIQNCNLDTAFSIAISKKSRQVQIILERHLLNSLMLN